MEKVLSEFTNDKHTLKYVHDESEQFYYIAISDNNFDFQKILCTQAYRTNHKSQLVEKFYRKYIKMCMNMHHIERIRFY